MDYAPPESPYTPNFRSSQPGDKPSGCQWLLILGLIAVGALLVYFLWKQCKKSTSKSVELVRYAGAKAPTKGLRECPADTFAQHIATGKMPCVIAFVAPWCGFCKQMKPALEQAAAQATVPVLTITYEKDKPWMQNLLKKYKIDGFPTIIKFQGGKAKTYSGDRSANSIVTFAKS